MVFSFFRKDVKETKEPARANGRGSTPARAAAKPTGKAPDPMQRGGAGRGPDNSKFATTDNAINNRELARSLAMETAAKIDAIESEMARDFLRPAANTGNPLSGPTTGGQKLSDAAPVTAATTAAIPVEADEAFDPHDGDFFLGSADAIEINTSGAGSVVDETAILFANGQDNDAEATLRNGIETDSLGSAPQNGWLMLFELINQRGDKASFEQLTMQYALRFENSPPAWMDYSEATVVPTASAVSGPVVQLPPVIDANIVKPLEQLKALASQHAALTLDCSATRGIDLVGAELLLRVINAFKRSSHELTLLGTDKLLNPLRAVVEPGRRDASDAAWMLLLEVLRLLNKQHDFEETGIQYCITFEVSPPSWEPPPPNLKTRTGAAAVAVVAAATDNPLEWRGTISGEGEPFFGRLALEARTNKHLIVDCRLLQRMAFSAASALLSQVMKLQAGGARVDFRHVNPLVAALFHLLGITAVANVQVRRN